MSKNLTVLPLFHLLLVGIQAVVVP